MDVDGHLVRSGYHIAMYLPDAAGNGLADTPANRPNIDPVKSEDYWTGLAWPQRRGNTGKPTYFINQQGELLMSTKANYSGKDRVPPPGAALVGGAPLVISSQQLAINTNGNDGNYWMPIN